MEKIIASRHFDVDEATKAYVIDELTKLEGDYQKLTSARVILDMQKSWYFTEIVLRGKNITIEAKSKAHELRVSISDTVEKTEVQLRKYLDRVHDHAKIPVSELELQTDEAKTGTED